MKTLKFIFSLALILIIGSSVTLASLVEFPLNSMFGGAGYTKSFKIESEKPLITDNTSIYIGSMFPVTPAGGTNPIVELTPNNYVVTFPDARTPWRIAVTNSTTVLNALTLTTGTLPTFNYVPPYAGGGGTNVVDLTGVVRTGGKQVLLVTNMSVVSSGFTYVTNSQNNYIVIGTFPSYAGGYISNVLYGFPGTTNVDDGHGLTPHTPPYLSISVDGGTTWNNRATTNGTCKVAVMLREPCWWTNVVLLGYVNNSVVNATNDLTDQNVFVSQNSTNPAQVVNLAGAQAAAAAAAAQWSTFPAIGPVDVNKNNLTLSPNWMTSIDPTNLALAFNFNGSPAFRYTPAASAVNGGLKAQIGNMIFTATNLQFTGSSTNTNAPYIWMTANLNPQVWIQRTTLTNFMTGGTNWHVWTDKPTNSSAFFRASFGTNFASWRFEVGDVSITADTSANYIYFANLTDPTTNGVNGTNGVSPTVTNTTDPAGVLNGTGGLGTNLSNLIVTNSAAKLLNVTLAAAGAYDGKLLLQSAVSTSVNDAGFDTYGGLRLLLPFRTGNSAHVALYMDGAGSIKTFNNAYGKTDNILFGFNTRQIDPYYTWNAWGNPQFISQNNGVNGWAGIPVTTYSPFNGGYGSTLEGLPVDGLENANALPLPPMALSTFSNGAQANQDQSVVTNMANNIFTNGLITALTNAGVPLIFHMDASTLILATNRDANGYLAINTNLFPLGTNFAPLIHNMGMLLEGTMYSYPFPTNQINVNLLGAPTQGTNCMPAMSVNTVRQDISKCYDFGWDAIRIADGNGTPASNLQMARQVAEAVLYPWDFTNKWNVIFSVKKANGGKGAVRPMATEFLFSGPENIPSSAQSLANFIGCDTSGDNWTGQITGGTAVQNSMNTFRWIYNAHAARIRPGHYPPATMNGFWGADHPKLETQVSLTQAAMSSCLVNFGFTTNMALELPNLLPYITNTTWLAIRTDPKVNRFYAVYDSGFSNISCYYKPLNGGKIAVAMFNEFAAATNMTVNFTNIGGVNGQAYSVVSAWDTNLNVGTFTGSYTHSNGVPGGGAALLLLTPAAGAISPLSISQTNVVLRTSFPAVSIYTNGYYYSTGGHGQATAENKVQSPADVRMLVCGISVANYINPLTVQSTNVNFAIRVNGSSAQSVTLNGPINANGAYTNVSFTPFTILPTDLLDWKITVSTGTASGLTFQGDAKLLGVQY